MAASGSRTGRSGRGAVAVACLLLAPALLANGGTLRVADAVMGDYRVSVYTGPTPPRPDSVDVSVLVVRDDDPRPVDGLAIRVSARQVGPEGVPGAFDGRTVTRTAHRSQADDPRYYAAKFAPGLPGEWLVEVSVSGPDGAGTASFRMEVREPGLLDRPWVVVTLALLPLAFLAWWLTRGSPTAKGLDAGLPGPPPEVPDA